MNRLFTLLAFLISGIAVGQTSDMVKINGVVVDEQEAPVPFVHVLNMNLNKGTASNEQGRFEIEMAATDTLIFSSIGYQRYSFRLKDSLKTGMLDVKIQLQTTTMELEAVEVFAYRDEQALKQAILQLEVPEEPAKRIQLEGFYYGPRKSSKLGFENLGFSGPITAVQNLFSKEAKQLKHYAKVKSTHNNWMANIGNKYNPAIVKEITGLPEQEVNDFMLFCEIEDNFIRLSSHYEIVVVVQKCLKDYEKVSDVGLEAPIKVEF